MWTDRTKVLIGDDCVKMLAQKHVCVVGIGGVGGYVCLMLARAGIGNFLLVDFDKVDETNINRQVVANTKTIGQEKTDIMKKMILEINPTCNVQVANEKLTGENVSKIILSNWDFVVDAIDSVQDKVELISYCKTKNINIVSAMGAGNRVGIPQFKVVDIYKTFNDGLAKAIRKRLKEKNVANLEVVTCEELPNKCDKTSSDIGSISYYPAMCGCVIGAHVVNRLLK